MNDRIFQRLPWQLWVKKRRQELDFTQEQVAERAACSKDMIGRVERGVNRPSAYLATFLARLLQVPPEEREEFVRVARLKPSNHEKKTSTKRPLALRIPGIPATALVGRASDLELVQQALIRSRKRLVTITGPPGVGKTRLAMSVAQDIEKTYPDGVLWVALASLRDPLRVLIAIAQTLGITETANQSLLEAIQVSLWGHRILLVLDNCEQIKEISSLVTSILVAPEVQILATSRRRIQVRGEQQIPLGPLAVPPETLDNVLDNIHSFSAATLFLNRAKETAPSFVLDESNALAIIQICAALDGLPLALELAAVRIHALPPMAMRAHLSERLFWLVGGPKDLPLRQQTLARTLDWSYNLLSSSQQILFNRLSVFEGGFTVSSANTVCDALGGIDENLSSGISELHEWSLLFRMSGQSEEPRFGMLATIQEYAATRLKESGEEDQLRDDHMEYFLTLAEQARATRSLADADAEAALSMLEREQSNFLVALDWSISSNGNLDSAGRLGVALSWFWETRGYWQEGRHWLPLILAQEDRLSDTLTAQLRYYAGRFAYLQGDYVSARRLLEASLTLSQQLEDASTQIQALNSLGWISYSQSDYHLARHFYIQSLSLCRRLGDPLEKAPLLNILGGIALEMGDLIHGEQQLEESLLLRQEQGDKQGMARSFNLLGRAAQHRDNPAQAQQLITTSVDLYSAWGDKLGLSLALSNLGWAYLIGEDPDQAEIWLSEALRVAEEVGSEWATTLTICYLGWVALQKRVPFEAARLFKESLTMAQTHGIKHVAILSRLGQGKVALVAEDNVQVAECLESVEQSRQEIGIILSPFERRIVAELEQAVLEHPVS
jgi:predicted ATPase/DNA-binding XRE family transcriptional regulator